MMAPTSVVADVETVGKSHPVEGVETTMQIHEVKIARPDIVAYLQGIPPEKREIALVHALEVGVIELIARRKRFSASLRS